MPGNQVAQQRLYLTAEKDRLVRQDDPAAAFLYCSPGDEIPASAAEHFGVVDGKLRPRRSEPALSPKPVTVQVAKPRKGKAAAPAKEKPAAEDKEAKPDENKSGDGQGGAGENGGGAGA